MAAEPLQQSNGRGSRSSRHAPPKELPKAPQSKEVAQRLLKHSTIRPIQRFDSADYYLDQHAARKAAEARQELEAELEKAIMDVNSPSAATIDVSWEQHLQTPPRPNLTSPRLLGHPNWASGE